MHSSPLASIVLFRQAGVVGRADSAIDAAGETQRAERVVHEVIKTPTCQHQRRLALQIADGGRGVERHGGNRLLVNVIDPFELLAC